MKHAKRAKITCAGFIMCGMTPVAVMVAAFKVQARTKIAVARYVFMTFDERSELDRMAYDLGRDVPDPSCPGLLDDHYGPAAVKTTAFDVETGASLDDVFWFDRRGEYWTNAEPLWINVDAYRPLVESIHQAWIKNNPVDPNVHPSARVPEARSWLAWTAIRKLNMAEAK